jgi:tRNA A-37 threonylcarbamoyl transferase component Bud32
VPKVLTCPQGHLVEVPAGADGRAADARFSCPVCGHAVAVSTPVAAKAPDETAAPSPGRTPDGDASHDAVTAAPGPPSGAPAIPGYEILEVLGRGGMGVVYKARQTKLDRLVALKVLPPETSSDPAFAERFGREARALARLNHPNIVTVHDFGQTDGQSYIVMEFVEGASLRQRLRAGRMSPDEALAVAARVCDALGYAHDEHIVHRDIKPENILLDRRGRVKIADFGLAKLLARKVTDYTLTGPWQVMGTLKYMAPEQVDNPLAVDHRADIYALGVVLYEMLTGGVPAGRFAPPSQKVPVDPRLDAIVLRALEEDPDRRFQRASDFEESLKSLERVPGSRTDGVGRAGTHVDPMATEVTDAESVRDKGILVRTGTRLANLLSWSVAFLLSTSGWAIFSCVLGIGGAAIAGAGLKYTPFFASKEAYLALAVPAAMLSALLFLLIVTTDFRAPNPAWKPWPLLLTGLGVILFSIGYPGQLGSESGFVFLTLLSGIALTLLGTIQLRGILMRNRSGSSER